MMQAVKQDGYADVEILLTAGLEHYANGRLREAAAAFHEALWLDPGNAQARDYLSSTLGGTGLPLEEVSNSRPPAHTATGWDDGASLQRDVTIPDDTSVPALVLEHLTQPTSRPSAPSSSGEARSVIEATMKEARDFEALGDFTAALDRCDKLLGLDEAHVEGLALQAHCARTLFQMYESRIGPRDGVPEVAARPDEMIWLNLDHRAGFVLAQIDGRLTYDDLYSVCGMSQLDTARVLSQLLTQSVIRTRARLTSRARAR
jgi:tetratricopeptide (TPR) repeat protein